MSDAVAQVTPAVRERRIPEWTFADKLRKVRTDMGLHQRDFAEQLEVGAPAYAAWESGRTRPQNIVSLAKRVELLSGVPAWWLLGLGGTESADYTSGQVSDAVIITGPWTSRALGAPAGVGA